MSMESIPGRVTFTYQDGETAVMYVRHFTIARTQKRKVKTLVWDLGPITGIVKIMLHSILQKPTSSAPHMYVNVYSCATLPEMTPRDNVVPKFKYICV